MMAHEFAHYAFMLFDEYFYFDQDNRLHTATCPKSLMADPYDLKRAGPTGRICMDG
ncbi:MAG: hypothetical protein R3A44_27330 [Caldilineaceae bacterium]